MKRPQKTAKIRLSRIFVIATGLLLIGILLLSRELYLATHTATWTRVATNPVMVGTQAFENGAVGEPTVITEGDHFRMYYTANGWITSSIGTATSSDGIHWLKVTHPIIGFGHGGEVSTQVARNSVYQENGITYLYYADIATKLPELSVATATNSLDFQKQSAPAFTIKDGDGWETSPANSSVVKDGSTYHLFLESYSAASNIYEIGHYTATSPLGPFKSAGFGKISSLQRGSGMYGGPWVMKTDTGWEMYYHYAVNAFIPTNIAHATSSDLIHWTQDGGAILTYSVDPFEFDQVADASVVYQGSKHYLFYSGVNNPKSTESVGLAISYK